MKYNFIYLSSNKLNGLSIFKRYFRFFLRNKISDNGEHSRTFSVFNKKLFRNLNLRFNKGYFPLLNFYKKRLRRILALKEYFAKLKYHFKRFEYM